MICLYYVFIQTTYSLTTPSGNRNNFFIRLFKELPIITNSKFYTEVHIKLRVTKIMVEKVFPVFVTFEPEILMQKAFRS